ncbi:MAG TPA: GTPase Era [Bacteroidales bacterium]|nr:GTPase Era [Bacteroidales bacterium]HQB75571.1 GTPase Era [Bacteroidales bacterium]HQQ21469.1 GTPase Era [Bacteroidales bacterium]
MNQETHRAGFVNIIGNPNVGKSTLMNLLVGERLSIITNKAQTTRHRIRGIVNGEDYQIVYSDLPGILDPAYKMQEMMMHNIHVALTDADLILLMVEVGETRFNEEIMAQLQECKIPKILIINKVDKSTPEAVKETEQYWTNLFPDIESIALSALHQIGIEWLQERIVQHLPVSPPFFPKDQLTDKPVRFFISEIIREKILLLYKKEIPYSVEVVVESYKEADHIVQISAMLYCERDTQKGILIGSKGSAIKQLGIESRKAIEEFIEKQVYLDLSVKVLKDWRNQDLMMKRFGYQEQ